jgi:carboxylesterase
MENVNLKEEYFLKGKKEACLLIHGFTSTPAELRELGEKVHEAGYTVLGVRLKGHGTVVEDMEKSTYKDWIDSAVEGYKKLKDRYEKIYVIGHSMGSLLALYISESFEVDKVIALSPPLVVKNKATKWAFIGKYFIRYHEYPPKFRLEEEIKYLLGYSKVSIRSVHELMKLIAKVKKNLYKIKKPLLIIHSHKDETVDEVSVDLLYNSVSSEVKEKIFLNKCGHNITIECEKEDVFRGVIDFLKK